MSRTSSTPACSSFSVWSRTNDGRAVRWSRPACCQSEHPASMADSAGADRRPPRTRTGDLVEVLHGVSVPDPYRWLEDGDSPETRAWVEAQNQFTRAVLDSLPRRTAIYSQLDRLLTAGAVGTPVVRGQRLFYQRRSGLQDQP